MCISHFKLFHCAKYTPMRAGLKFNGGWGGMLLNDHDHVVAAPAFPAQVFPNGYPGYPIRGDSSQPSLGDDRGHPLMSLEDQVRHFSGLQFRIHLW